MHAPRRLTFDIPLFLAVVALVAIGIIMVFSSSALLGKNPGQQSTRYFVQQVLGALAGFGIVVALLRTKRSFFLHPTFIYGLLGVTGFLLMLCYVMPRVAGTHRWVQFFGIRFQPSELAKIGLVLFFAFYCETKKDTLNEWKTLLQPFGVVAAAVLLVAFETDFGTAVMLAGLSGMMMFIGGVKPKRLLALVAACAVIFPLFLIGQNYRGARFRGFTSGQGDTQGQNYQVNQSKIAVGAGGLIGVGLGESTQRMSFLPFAHTDFIYAILGEETGLLGTTITLGLFLLLLWRGMKIASAAPDPALKMVAAGLSLMIAAQALANITIVLGMGPTKGIPLPFLSYGRSSLVCSLAAAGILLHISQKRGGRVEHPAGRILHAPAGQAVKA